MNNTLSPINDTSSKAFDKLFARFLGSFHQPEFYQINSVLGRLEQLYDICRFNYFSTLRTFNPDFSSYIKPTVGEMPNVVE